MSKLINLAVVLNLLASIKNMIPAQERGPVLQLTSKVKLLEEAIQKELTPILGQPKNADRAKQYFDACQKYTDELQKLVDHELPALLERIQKNASGALSSSYSTGLIEQLKNNLKSYLTTLKDMKLNYDRIKTTFYYANIMGSVTTLLGGVVLPMDQTIDPLMGGYIDDDGNVKTSEGNCGGKSFKHIKQYTDHGHATYPILADHEVQKFQNDQLNMKQEFFFPPTERFNVLDFDFKSWIKTIAAGESFYLALFDGSGSGHAVDLCKRHDNTFDFFDSNSGNHFCRDENALSYILNKMIINYRKGDLLFQKFCIYKSIEPIKKTDVSYFPMQSLFDVSLLAHEPKEREESFLTEIEDTFLTDEHYDPKEDPEQNWITYFLELRALAEFAELPETLERLAKHIDDMVTAPDTNQKPSLQFNSLRAACQNNAAHLAKMNELKNSLQAKRNQLKPVVGSKAQQCLAGIETMQKKLHALTLEKCSVVAALIDLPDEEFTPKIEEELLTAKRQLLVLEKHLNNLQNSELFNLIRNALSQNVSMPFDLEQFKSDLDELIPNASLVLLKNKSIIEQFIIDSLKPELNITVTRVQTNAVDALLTQILACHDAIVDPTENPASFIEACSAQRNAIQKNALSELHSFIKNQKQEWLDGVISFDDLQAEIKNASQSILTLNLDGENAQYSVALEAMKAESVKDLPQLPASTMEQLNGIYQLLMNETETGLIAVLDKQFATSLKHIGNQTLFLCIRDHMQRQIKRIKDSLKELADPKSLCSQDGNVVAGLIIETFNNHFGAILTDNFQVSAEKLNDTVTHLANNQRYQHIFDILLNELKALINQNETLLGEVTKKFSGCKNIIVYQALHQFICDRHEALCKRADLAVALKENFLRLGGVGVSALIDRMRSVFNGTNVDFMHCSDAEIAKVARSYYNKAILEMPAFKNSEDKLVKLVVAGQLNILPIVAYIDNKQKESTELFGLSVACDYPLLSQRNLSLIRLKALEEPFRKACDEMNSATSLEAKALALLNIPAYLAFYNKDFLELNEQHQKQCQKSTNTFLETYKEFALMLQRSNMHNLIEHVLQLMTQHQNSHQHIPGIATMQFNKLLTGLTEQLKKVRDIHGGIQTEGLLTKEHMSAFAKEVNRVVGAEIMDQFGLVVGYKKRLIDHLENKFSVECNNPLQSIKDSAWSVTFGALIKMGSGVSSKATNSAAVEAPSEFRYTQ